LIDRCEKRKSILLHTAGNVMSGCFHFLEILRTKRAHGKEPGRNEEQNETGTFFTNI